MKLTFDYSMAAKWLNSGRQNPACLSYYEKSVGGLSKPSKMPWYGWSISATKCNVGSALRDIPNSVCSGCYALKGRYCFGNVQDALERRFMRWETNPSKWAARMVLLLEGKSKGKEQHFRWFDSGDVQGIDMLHAIVWIAHQLPHIKFWLPTKEYKLFKRLDVLKLLVTAPNLTVRISAPMVGQVALNSDYRTSSVGAYEVETKETRGQACYVCPAKKHNNGKCGDCRACWSAISNIDYPKH